MLEISLLGERVVRDMAGTVHTMSTRTHALVAFLVVHAGMPQSRQRIAATFWPDSSDEQALTNLRRELHHLRHALDGDESLVVTSRDLCWQDTETCRVDLRDFDREHAAAIAASAAGSTTMALGHADVALGLYRGELLPGNYDDWVLDARAEVEQRCVDLLDLVCEIRTELCDVAGAAESARRRIQYRPLEEVGYRRLIELQGELGDRAGAVSTYHHCASVLERELGIEPDPETRRALDRLMTRTPQVEPVPAAASAPGRRSGPAAARLIGRAADFDTLQRVWQRAAEGHPGLALVHGDPGVGKTRLVTELADSARAVGAVVANAQCFGTAGQLALSPVADWLRTPSVQAELTTLDPVWRDEVERLVPPARGRVESGSSSRAVVDAWQRHRFVEGLARALLGIGRPTLLTLDNVQWCDQETLAFVAFLLGLAGDAPVMIAGTVRNDHPPGLADWTARIRATGMLTDIALSPLDATETTRLAEAISGRPLTALDADLLQATTGGFPLYIVEAGRGGDDERAANVPAGDLRAVLRNRLDQVTVHAREVAGLAAAVGRDFSLDLITEASDLDADTVVHAIDELWRQRILREIGDGYDFSHDLLRETAYAQVSPPKRWLLHRRIAQGLELSHPDDPDVISAQLAEQYARGGRVERAITYYRRAADVAALRFAHAEVIRLLEEALTLVRAMPDGRERNAQELGLLEAIAAPLNARFGYSSTRLHEALERSIALAEQLGRRRSLLTALVGMWGSQFVYGYALDAYRTAHRALALVEPGSELSGAAHFAVAGSSVSIGRLEDALHHFELAVEFGGSTILSIGNRPDVHGRAFAAHAHWLLGDDAQAAARANEAIALARSGDTPYNIAVALAYAAATAQFQNDVPTMQTLVAELRELCERYDFAYYREWALIFEGWTRGEASGLEQARRGVDNLVAQRAFTRLPYWLSLVADVAQRAGFPEVAVARLDAALAAGQARHDMWWLPEVMRMRAAHDDNQAAVARLEAAAKLAAGHGSIALVGRCLADLAERGVRDHVSGVPDRS